MTTGQSYSDQERVYNDCANSWGQAGRRFVQSGCEVTAQGSPDMTVNVASGVVYFGSELVGVESESNLTITASNPTLNRFDLVVVNSSGVVSVLTGTPLSESTDYGPVPPAFDPETYVVLARISITNGTTTIETADIKDMRMVNPAGSGTGGGVGKYNINVTNQTTAVITHNLNDSVPIVEVWDQGDPTIRIVPDVVEIIDDNSLRVDFTSSSTVRVSVHGGVFNDLNATQARDEVAVSDATSVIYTHSNAVIPVVQFIDEYGIVKNSGFTIDHTSENTVQVDFDVSTSGTLVMVGGALSDIRMTTRYQVQFMQADETYPASVNQLGTTPTIDFAATQTSGVIFNFVPPFNIDTSQDVTIQVQYIMSTATTEDVIMQLDLDQYADGDTVTSDVQTSMIETLSVPATANTLEIQNFATMKIPASYINTSRITTMELWRKDTDSHDGDLRILNLDLIYQTSS